MFVKKIMQKKPFQPFELFHLFQPLKALNLFRLFLLKPLKRFSLSPMTRLYSLSIAFTALRSFFGSFLGLPFFGPRSSS